MTGHEISGLIDSPRVVGRCPSTDYTDSKVTFCVISVIWGRSRVHNLEEAYFNGRRKIRKPQASSGNTGKPTIRFLADCSGAGASGGSGGAVSGVTSVKDAPLPTSTDPKNGRFERLIATSTSSS